MTVAALNEESVARTKNPELTKRDALARILEFERRYDVKIAYSPHPSVPCNAQRFMAMFLADRIGLPFQVVRANRDGTPVSVGAPPPDPALICRSCLADCLDRLVIASGVIVGVRTDIDEVTRRVTDDEKAS